MPSLIGLGILIAVVLIAIPIIDSYLPIRFFCDKLGWHHTPKKIGFDGCSLTGTCPRCGKHVMQDSQGNWF